MEAARAHRVETGVGYAAATAFAAAVGLAGYQSAARITDMPGMAAVGGISAILAYPVAQFMLRVLGGAPTPFSQPVFDILKIEPVDPEELLLTDRVQPADAFAPLELDDILVEVAPGSRVVQLFDPSAMPTPRQLKARIDRHLDGGTSHSPSPDASEALFAALSDLRRSLR